MEIPGEWSDFDVLGLVGTLLKNDFFGGARYCLKRIDLSRKHFGIEVTRGCAKSLESSKLGSNFAPIAERNFLMTGILA